MKKYQEFVRNVAGRGFLWGPLADEAVSHQAAGARNNGDDDAGDELLPGSGRAWVGRSMSGGGKHLF